MDIDLDSFDPEHPPEGMPEHIVEMLTKAKEAKVWSDSGPAMLREAMKPMEEHLEQEVFFKYWQHISDGTESYQASFKVAHCYCGCLLAVRKRMKKIAKQQRPAMLRSLARACDVMADMYESTAKVAMEHEAQAPDMIKNQLKKMHLDED